MRVSWYKKGKHTYGLCLELEFIEVVASDVTENDNLLQNKADYI